MTWDKVLDVDTDHVFRNRTWWWWWLLFFFRNPADPLRWRQLVLLWGTRNCRKLVVNGHEWRNDLTFRRTDQGLEVDGMTAAWYYDGRTMHDPLFVDDGHLLLSRGGDGGKLELANGGNAYAYDVSAEPNRVRVRRPDCAVNLEILPWVPHLDGLVPTGKQYLWNLGYRMFKVRGQRARGTITAAGRTDAVEGTVYFQNVRINSPTSPWYWSAFHSENGSYLDYFMPHMGPPAMRRTERHASRLDWGERSLSRGLIFVDGRDGKVRRVKNLKMRKTYAGDLPTFTLTGEDAATAVRMVMETYARAYWKIEQPFLGILTSRLYYNEYPAILREFEFREGSKRTTLNDLGSWVVGNCEHAWGIV
ncbi:MAG TPA: hypothetical protein VJ397_04910 [Thermoplasmata archaeon]|nr:hypothetical protein [Thermoplasmata archaeon]